MHKDVLDLVQTARDIYDDRGEFSLPHVYVIAVEDAIFDTFGNKESVGTARLLSYCDWEKSEITVPLEILGFDQVTIFKMTSSDIVDALEKAGYRLNYLSVKILDRAPKVSNAVIIFDIPK